MNKRKYASDVRVVPKYYYSYGTCYERVEPLDSDKDIPEIILDLSQAMKAAELSGISLSDAIGQMLAHEMLHHVLYECISIDACDKLDNIACDRFDDGDAILYMLKYMIGGILCKKDIPNMNTKPSHRMQMKGKRGRPKKLRPLRYNHTKSLGGIPVKCKNGKISYTQFIPKNYGTDKYGEYFDEESAERDKAELPDGEGSFIRRHVYETRFEIGEETEEERRKREYKEWWDEQ